jgi:hypothetical protein
MYDFHSRVWEENIRDLSMSNVFDKIGHGIKVGAEDVAKGVVDVVEWTPKAIAVLATAIKDRPEVKSAVLALVKQATAVIADVGVDVAGKGINLAADTKTLADAEAFFVYFRGTFIPLIEQVYTQVAADVQS